MAQGKKKSDKPAAKDSSKRATKRKPAASGAARAAQQNPIELPEGMWERIAKKAYDLWVERGRREGGDLQNWLEAEAIVMEEIHEARE
ncbi:MAG: DUF2934 domain-containing protein [Nitrospira sp.]|nr:DUF2934 domain-containing protein [Nitrospira sp.]